MIIHGIPVRLTLNDTIKNFLAVLISIAAGLLLRFWETGSRVAGAVLFPTGLIYVKLFFLLAMPLVCLQIVCGVIRHLQNRENAKALESLWRFHSVNSVGAAVLGMVAGCMVCFSGIPVFHSGTVRFGLPVLRLFFPGAVLLSVVIAFAAVRSGAAGEAARNIFLSLAGVFGMAGTLLLKFLPVGIFMLLCPVVALQGAGVLWLPVKLTVLTVFCCFAYGMLVCGYHLRHCGKDSPRHFMRYFKAVLLQAFSDAHTEPFEEAALRSLQRLGITGTEGRDGFRQGCSFGCAGTVIYCGIACMAAAQYAGMELSFRLVAGVFVWIVLLLQTNLDFPGAGLFCALAVIIMAGIRPEAAIPLLLCEWLLGGVRSVLDTAFAGVGVYLADKLGWMK
ncbi:MAG: cation:dicarboxylase symporter family transporter [Acidaminococcaceae bacterium]|nr:cation:dicarboxylase symporter family transporter [Acidaminococcaceae bacterium]